MTEENEVLKINPEQIRIKLSEVIRMRNAARQAYGLMKDMSVEERTRRIVEVHAVSTKIKVFLQELVISEEEALEEASEEERDVRRKLDRQYKSTRGMSDEERETKAKSKSTSNLADLAKTAGIDISALLKKVAENKKAQS